jgi:PAS domain S-box-containing protein
MISDDASFRLASRPTTVTPPVSMASDLSRNDAESPIGRRYAQLRRRLYSGFVLALFSVLMIGIAAYRITIDGAERTRPQALGGWIAIGYVVATGSLLAAFIALRRDLEARQRIESELRRTQEELEHFFSVSLDFLTIAGGDGYFKRVNPTVTDVLGWTVEEFLRTPYLDLIHPDDREPTLREVERQLVRGEKVLHFENRYRAKDGSWRVLSWRSVPYVDGLMYGAARDVTESHRAAEEIGRLNATLRQHAAQLEAANKELEAFSYSVSHDLRAPLRHIQGYVAMLRRESASQLNEKATRYLDTIVSAAQEMGALIDQLLSFARMGRTELRLDDLELQPLVEETRTELEASAGGHAVRWKVHALPVVRADRILLKQVWLNLLGNAVKYTRPCEHAQIEVGCAGETDREVVLYVRDNGVGFDMKYADKLFGVFQRLHRADEFEGTGVGLANVQRIVRRHGGRVWADAKVGAGATFYFSLPRASAAPTAERISA